MTNDFNAKRLEKLEERVGQLEVEFAELVPAVAELISAREPAPVLRLVEGESDDA